MCLTRGRLARRRDGISLIEVLTVVLVLAVSATVAIFKLSSARTADPARQSAQSFIAMLNKARELAIAKETPVTVTLDTKCQPSKWIFASAAGKCGPAAQWDLPIEGLAQVAGTTVPIRLDCAGNASYFGEWRFLATNRYSVVLEPIGARIALKALD
jgi:type II secretory pathway pseudopilin PulG